MRQFKSNKWIFILSLLFLFSCSKDNEIIDSKSSQQENFVNLSAAKEIGSGILFKSSENNSYSGKNNSFVTIKKKIETVNEVKNDIGNTVFYVINYVNGGFIILSADNRAEPIIGFSEDNKFVLDNGKDKSYPLVLKSWLENVKKHISNIQTSKSKQTKEEELIWRQVQNMMVSNGSMTAKSAIADIPMPDCYEHTESRSQGPFLKMKWWQFDGFNDALGYISCTSDNQHVYAGCVPIAMAQVMKYYQYPTNYNWSAMPMDSAAPVTANLILDIHNAIGSVYPGQPVYNCNGTGVGSDISLVLKSKFNYSSAQLANYSYQTVINELDAGRPVILEGVDKSSFTGHMWVCDGYYVMNSFFDNCTGVTSICLSMNWGWKNGKNNGFYSINNFNPNSANYSEALKMTYNIKP